MSEQQKEPAASHEGDKGAHGPHLPANFRATLVTEIATCRRIVEQLCQTHTEVGLDCEVADEVFIFDVATNPGLISELKPVLEGPIIKIIHDCRQDSDALYHQHNIILANVFDTQIGDAVLKRQRWETHPHYSPSRPFIEPLPISYRKLLQIYCRVTIDKQGIRDKMNEDQSFWSQRPLTTEAIQYAAADVYYLPVVFRVMRDALSAAYWEMAMIRSAIYLDEYRSNEYGPAIFREKLRMRFNYAASTGPASGSSIAFYYRDQHYQQYHPHQHYYNDHASGSLSSPNGTPNATPHASTAVPNGSRQSAPITRQIVFNPNAPVFQPQQSRPAVASPSNSAASSGTPVQ